MAGPRSHDDRLTVVIVGAGRVGSTTAYASLITGLANSIVLVDEDEARAEGEAMDLVHGLPYVRPATIEAGGYSACRNADLVIVTAGAARQPGDTRIDLSKRNLALAAEMVPRIMESGFDGVFLVVSNPVDLMTQAVQRLSGLPRARVLGTGTTLDTARLRTLLARHFQLAARNVHAYVIGEHGETEVPVWSLARIANLTLDEFARAGDMAWDDAVRQRLGDRVRQAGAEVIKRKGSTHYAIGLAIVQVARAVLRDERTIMTVGSVLAGEQGIEEVALSLPCLIGRDGRLATIPLSLDAGESAALTASAEALRQAYRDAGGPA